MPLSLRAAESFPAFEVSPSGEANPRFQSSQGLASSDDPIVISVVGRNLRAKNRQHRTGLQTYWLKRNFPAGCRVLVRSLVECHLESLGQFGACYESMFLDASGTKHSCHFCWQLAMNPPDVVQGRKVHWSGAEANVMHRVEFRFSKEGSLL